MKKTFWENYYEAYDALNRVIPYSDLLERVVEEAEVKDGDLVLDAGCGTGNLAVRMTAKGAWVVGIDNQKEAIGIYQKKDPLAQASVHDLLDPLPFVDRTFDTICCNNVMYTIDPGRRGKVLQEFRRVLKPGGSLVISNPHINMSIIEVYKDHLLQTLANKGVSAMAKEIFEMALPALRVSFYDRKIAKLKAIRRCSYVSYKEQEKALEGMGFKVLKSVMVYADQGVLVKAER